MSRPARRCPPPVAGFGFAEGGLPDYASSGNAGGVTPVDA
jgi:hypothetical protein